MILTEREIADIIHGCKQDDRLAQEKLYRSFYPAMMSLCLRYTKNESDALEVMNTGFYKIYKNINLFDSSKAALSTWIRTIIINSCLDNIKSKNRFSGTVALEQATHVDVPPAAFSRLSAAEILVMVRQLPPMTQMVFNLFVIDGYKHTEIATMTGMSEGTSKWHLSEARKKLQSLLEQQL